MLHNFDAIRCLCVCVCVCVVLLRLLFWTEKQLDGEGRLMQCRLDGSGPRTVLRRRRQRLRNSRSSISTQTSSRCTCPELSVALSFAVDYTQPESQLKIYVADSDSGDIWSVDEAGCHCQLIVNATTLSPTSSDIGQYTRTGLLLLCHKSYTVKTVICKIRHHSEMTIIMLRHLYYNRGQTLYNVNIRTEQVPCRTAALYS